MVPRVARDLCFCAGLVGLLLAAACGEAARDGGASPVPDVEEVSLEPTFDSPDALARAFLDALEREDGERLRSLALSEEQFRVYVWPQLPSSKPERNVPFEFGWGDLHQKSHNALVGTFSRYKGVPLDLVEVRFEDGATDYETYIVHRDARVKVRRENGKEEWLDLFGSVMEWNGRFKLFSNVTD